MTLPKARKIDVDGKNYDFIVKKARRGALRLTVDFGNNEYLQATFTPRSLETVMENERDLRRAFPPQDVYAVIKAAPRGVLPEDFELANWLYQVPEK